MMPNTYRVTSDIFTYSCISLITTLSTLWFLDLHSVGQMGYTLIILTFLFVIELLKLSTRTGPKLPGKKVSLNVAKNTALIMGMIAVYHAVFVSFGAQLLAEYRETALLAALMSLLTVLPGCLQEGHEVTLDLLRTLTVSNSTLDYRQMMLRRNMQLTVLGCWLGAVVIPLDWNRHWQQWPVPCFVGALGGYGMGNLLTLACIRYYAVPDLCGGT